MRKYAPKAHLERLDEIETAFANRLVQFYRLAMTPVLITEPQHGARK